MASKKITVAFAGEGQIDLAAVKALLNDWLDFGDEDDDGFPAPSKNDITLLLPVSESGLGDTPLATVMEWIDYVDLPYILVTDSAGSRSLRGLIRNAHDVVETNNIGASLINTLEAQADGEKYLVLLWGEEGDQFSDSLLDLASAAEIPVKDLTAGLDDIVFADDEPEPEETSTEEEIPAGESSTEQEVLVPGTPVATGVEAVLQDVYTHLYYQDQANAARNLQPVRRSPLTDRVLQALQILRGEDTHEEATEESEDEPKASRGRPRKDGSPAQPRTEEDLAVAYIKSEGGEYRKRGRGRPKSGEEVVMLTPTQVKELGLDT